MNLAADIQTFVDDWVAQNVREVKGLSNISGEVNRLAAGMTGDARVLGISGGDLHRTVGDIDEYLTEQYELAAAAVV